MKLPVVVVREFKPDNIYFACSLPRRWSGHVKRGRAVVAAFRLGSARIRSGGDPTYKTKLSSGRDRRKVDSPPPDAFIGDASRASSKRIEYSRERPAEPRAGV